MIVEYFRAPERTKVFNKGQKVWIENRGESYFNIYFRYRGNGKYVRGTIDINEVQNLEIKVFDVDLAFYNRVNGIEQPTTRVEIEKRKRKKKKSVKKSTEIDVDEATFNSFTKILIVVLLLAIMFSLFYFTLETKEEKFGRRLNDAIINSIK